ncbi:hypothetical protein CF319_g2780 [Tilletia indica]|nr:hypothetical protein CF319_g2780 [Tilletia indica]
MVVGYPSLRSLSLSSKVGILQAQDSGTYAGLGVAGTDLGSRVALLQLDVARHGGEEETELEPTTGANLLYCGTTRRTVAQRIFEHDKCTTTAKANPDHLHNLHYSERAIAREFDYVVISSPVAAQTLERDEQLVIWELFDARFLGAWLGNTADVERCATTMPERRLRILGLNSTPIRKGLSNRVEATRFIAKTNPNQFWSEVKLVAETLPQMSQPVLVDWSSFSSERQGNIQDTQIEWRAAQLRALLDGSLLCRLHRGFSKVLFFLFDCKVGLNTFDRAQLGFYPAPDQEEGSMIRIDLSFSDASSHQRHPGTVSPWETRNVWKASTLRPCPRMDNG